MSENHNRKNLGVFIASVAFLSALLALDHLPNALVAYQSVASPNIAILTLGDSILGSIEEGQTVHYTPTNQTDLNDIISVTTAEETVYLHLSSNLDDQSGNYGTYDIVIKFDTVPSGSSHNTGDTACTLSLTSPEYSSIDLDVAGAWTFDFEITATANSVSADHTTTVTVSAEITFSYVRPLFAR